MHELPGTMTFAPPVRIHITSRHHYTRAHSTTMDNLQQQKSINTLIRENARQRLFIKPLLWSERHLELLGCAFAEDQSIVPTTDASHHIPPPPADAAKSHDLATAPTPIKPLVDLDSALRSTLLSASETLASSSPRIRRDAAANRLFGWSNDMLLWTQ